MFISEKNRFGPGNPVISAGKARAEVRGRSLTAKSGCSERHENRA